MKRLIAFLLTLSLSLSLCACNAGVKGDTEPPVSGNHAVTDNSASVSEEEVKTEVTTTVTTTEATTTEATATDAATTEAATTESTATEVIATTEEPSDVTVTESEVTPDDTLSQEDFVHTSGSQIIGTDGKSVEIRGISMGNTVWSNLETPNYYYCTEESYEKLAELGFNSVRFYLNYALFESDDDPYNYKEEGFEWIDLNIEWAKKYGIGIILNMHYPQGGFQSNGDGLELWLDESNQDRLAALWAEIASRYADEPTIWGYGLINEPYAPLFDTIEKTAGVYKALAQRITTAIRKEAPYQMIFVERLINIVNVETGDSNYWTKIDPELAFPLIDDDNVVFEFHSYSPHTFTHQDTDWAGTAGATMEYSPDVLIETEMENNWVGCVRSKGISTEDGWTFHKTETVTLSEDYNMLLAAANAPGTGYGGKVYYDDLTVYEISPDGEERILYQYSFDEDLEGFTAWSEDGSGYASFMGNGGRNRSGCMVISDAVADFSNSGQRFAMKAGYSYYITGYIKNAGYGNPTVRLDFAKAKDLEPFDINYLEKSFYEAVEFSQTHNVPLYLGEFGVILAGFEDGRNGIGWVSDMIDICRKYGIGFNYHDFHGASFGLYRNYDIEYPDDINTELADLFYEKFN